MTGLSLCLVVVLAVVVTRTARHDVEPQPLDVRRASPAAASAALASFADAVDSRDPEALTALAPPDEPATNEVLAGIARTARALDLREVSARFVDQVGTVADDGAWMGVAELTWQFGGIDERPSRADVMVTFAPRGDELGIMAFGDPDATVAVRLPLWLRGDLSVTRAEGILVLVDGSQVEADTVARRVETGVDVVRRVLPAWRGPVVVEIPGSATDLDATLGADPGTYAEIAAVTAVAGSSHGVDAPVHVFVNPEVTDGLRRAGAQVVMSHEIAHLATDAARSTMELWLVEGFADYVALRDTSLPDRTTLGRAIDAVRRDGVPDALPSEADFDTRAADLQARYEEAWLACRIIAERLGEPGLLAVYDAVRAGEPVDRVLRRAGLPVSGLTAIFRARLRNVAG